MNHPCILPNAKLLSKDSLGSAQLGSDRLRFAKKISRADQTIYCKSLWLPVFSREASWTFKLAAPISTTERSAAVVVLQLSQNSTEEHTCVAKEHLKVASSCFHWKCSAQIDHVQRLTANLYSLFWVYGKKISFPRACGRLSAICRPTSLPKWIKS